MSKLSKRGDKHDKRTNGRTKKLFKPASMEEIRVVREALQDRDDGISTPVDDKGVPNPKSLFDKRTFGLVTHRNTIGIPE